MTSANTVSATRLIPAPADQIFDLLADPGRHPEIDGSGTVVASRSRGERRLKLGDVFGMDMRMGVAYRTRCVVVEFVEDRLIAWQVRAPAPLNKVFTGRIWRYELQPTDGGTMVTETWDISSEALPARALVRATMAGSTRVSMERTLARIESVLAAKAS